MLTAYFDESTNPPTRHNPNAVRVYTIAGCVGMNRQWMKFQKGWKAALDREVLPKWQEVYGAEKPVYFHMTDFDNPHSKIYKDWPASQKVKFLKELHGLMAKHTQRRFATSIILSDYEELTVEEQFVFGNPHICATINCCKHIRRWADEVNLRGPILYVFEKGSIHDKAVRQLFENMNDDERNAYRAGGIAIKDKRDFLPLQAADILAFETRKELARQLDASNTRRARESIKNLNVPMLDDWFYMGRQHFRDILDRPDVSEVMKLPEFKAQAAIAKKKGLI